MWWTLVSIAAVSVRAQQAAPSITLSTVIASPSAPLSQPLPSQVPLPPKQAWCPSEIFCAGPLLQTVNVANIYVDPKTFVDKPTNASAQSVLAAFNALGVVNGTNTTVTEGQIVDFVDTQFQGEGLELEGLPLDSFNPSPAFIENVTDPLVKAFTQTVHGFWPQLIRGTNRSTLCDGSSCESSLIPLNHTFVVPGGRFREQYYWDSFWIVEGLLESELYSVVNDTLQNFMDELERFGFIPNGGRIYYLNRSQPPLFIQMLYRYVTVSGDTTILERALPLAEKELTWWQTNRSVNVTLTSNFSSSSNTTSLNASTTHHLYHYSVNNSAPRPESYLTDYHTANPPVLLPNGSAATDGSVQVILDEEGRSALYAELASGAETGWDYTARWVKGLSDRVVEVGVSSNASSTPILGNTSISSNTTTTTTTVEQVAGVQVSYGPQNANWTLRDLAIRDTIPVDLNSILYKNHVLLAELYNISFVNCSSPSPEKGAAVAKAAARHLKAADALKEGILSVFWNPQKLAFYDFSLSSGEQHTVFSVAAFYPYWAGIYPAELFTARGGEDVSGGDDAEGVDQDRAFGAFASVNLVLRRYNGTFPSTFVSVPSVSNSNTTTDREATGLQWDAPNTWPPHQYIVLQALRGLRSLLPDANVSVSSSIPNATDSFSLVPPGQLGLAEAELTPQPISATANATSDINVLNGTVSNGGNSSTQGWVETLERELANRYVASVLCSWHATGGSIEGILPKLSDQELNVTNSVGNTGNMFEKFSYLDIDVAGQGGEYTVQAGFGWTNGVLLWVAARYGDVLVAPTCPDLLNEAAATGSG
ncbi:hypothetical protein D9758_013212 [Tetrapyrgos nigripes]|uniref:Trehalase n=1 Tax=Tetrapyrgos nigripes TaxID=182062 RepID=A0A8H5FS18_9AGAR|nr:hypothetical protein D9758_013212 [Tetrapyrgos nigripes]